MKNRRIRPRLGSRRNAIFEPADKALYQAKGEGRGRSQVAGAGSSAPL